MKAVKFEGNKVDTGFHQYVESTALGLPGSHYLKRAFGSAGDRTPLQVEQIAPILISKKLRVCCYCRVSTLLDSQETSIEGQREHYETLIKANPEWEFAGVYLEAGVSGTKAESRPELQRLIEDCKAGKVDLILTKSISRFARNTSDCLKMDIVS